VPRELAEKMQRNLEDLAGLPAALQHTGIGHGYEVVSGHDEVVVQPDPDGGESVFDEPGTGLVVLGGDGDTADVVVGENDAAGVQSQGPLREFTDADVRGGGGAPGELLAAEDF